MIFHALSVKPSCSPTRWTHCSCQYESKPAAGDTIHADRASKAKTHRAGGYANRAMLVMGSPVFLEYTWPAPGNQQSASMRSDTEEGHHRVKDGSGANWP